MNPVIIGALAAGFLLMLGAGVALLTGSRDAEVDDRLDDFVGSGTIFVTGTEEDAGDNHISKQQDGASERFDKMLKKRGYGDKIRDRISKADVKLKPVEYIGLQIAAMIGVGFLSYRFFGGSTVLAIVGGAFGLRIPRMYMSFAATRRIHRFDDQLSDMLNLWVNSLRSGYSVLQGMEAIATELPAPVSVEFERVVQEVRLGLSLSDALNNMLRRVPSEDLDLVVTAVNIQREVGGNLAEILGIISHTVRERVRIKGEIRTMTAQGRISGWVVGLLPVGLGLILYRINPEYISELWAKEPPFIFEPSLPCGYCVIGLGLGMIAAGVYAIMRIVDIEV